ncbi:MAG: bifunctional phosphoribosylaminoimidazolecarboxamide formyltransferase/IMP cyclohydrolase [Candidatus Eisenbacteria bacterium]|nr:bifunctional phosphoribosylaminoimidazolecarboxamide formyltransferase/IMP cyclohydrolase [Candidatus Eisenbacteria bacterium]
MIEVRRALLSGWDKEGMLELARALAPRGVELLATRGTASALEEQDIAVTRLEAWLGFPEILGGRVKTLHPRLHAGILAPRTPAGLHELESIGSAPIDLVAADLYPFEDAVSASPGDRAHGVEHIDIGGVTLLRAAAKNAEYVAVLPDAASRAEFLSTLAEAPAAPRVEPGAARRWAARAFRITSAYDAAIAAWTCADEPLPSVLALGGRLSLPLRYGENPHQPAAWYRGGGELPFERLHEGREISWNNLLDLEAATGLAGELAGPAAVIVKHTNPCGACQARTVLEAVRGAWGTDPLSAFGGIVAVRGALDDASAALLAEQFVEVVAAESFEPAALARLRAKKGLRILRGPMAAPGPAVRVRSLLGGIGAQAGPHAIHGEWRDAGKRAATEPERADMELAWRVAAAAQSNGIALVRGGQLIGLGSGQTSRVDSVHMALYKAARNGHDPRGAVLASDGFFPFRDGVDMAAEAGVAAVVQPGGSRRDAEVIAAADERGMAMVMTGCRCFRH